jgi:hypothetical protein
VNRRAVFERLVASLVFVMAAACFALPFLSVSVDQRRGEATGIQLVREDEDLQGHYVHDSYRGEVEQLVNRGELPAKIVLAFAVAGIAVAWVPGLWGLRLPLAAALLGLLGMAIFMRTTMPPFTPPDSDRRYGFWLLGALLVAAGTWCIVRLRRERVLLYD